MITNHDEKVAKNADFEVWCDDRKMPAAWEVKDLPEIPPDKQKELDEKLKTFIKESLTKTEENLRIAV